MKKQDVVDLKEKNKSENNREVKNKSKNDIHSELNNDTQKEITASEKSEKKLISNSFPIVGIGASAGGLAAFEAFFSGMPTETDPGMAFVLVQHLAPDHKSILAELIRRYTRMQVFEVEDGMVVEPNCAYIIPPGFDMAFLNGALQLFEPSAPRGQRLSIDFFFRSLAQDQSERAIGIVLSGTGSDGTLGVRAIKGEGGMVMVQTPESTEYDAMPRSVIATGLADYELAPAQMAVALIAYSIHAFQKNKTCSISPAPKFENTLKKIFILVRSHTGNDFSSYKLNTIRRRVERRMAVLQIDSIEDYLRCLQQSNDEIESLFKDLLIGVTNFFRDKESFDYLKEIVIPKLFVGKSSGSLVRVWSAGCSTGEEAYSIAILLQEYMESTKHNFTAQVFATDIDPRSIALARSGVYPASIAADITEERLERFFTPDPGGRNEGSQTYRINKNIRDMLIFSEQNIIKDPPFSKLDLICCRNLMIYLSGDLQKKLMPIFHYALNQVGFLFLGSSESVGEFTNLFQLIDRKSKLYMRKDSDVSNRRVSAGNIYTPRVNIESAAQKPGIKKMQKEKISLRELTEQTLLKQLAPSSALVNGQGDIFYLHSRTGMFLEPVVGEVCGYNIIKMAREGLRYGLTITLREAVNNKKITTYQNLSVKTNTGFITVNLTICPAEVDDKNYSVEQMYLVVFEKTNHAESGQNESDKPALANEGEQSEDNSAYNNLDRLVTSLRDELHAKDEYLQTAIEDLETSNEELKSSNEEMQSVNEELQSANEELETSKEELQSVNEELSTVNNELSSKVSDLSQANNDMNNLLAGTGIATVFVNHRMQILRFTPTASLLINLIQGDIGRPVSHILTNLSGYESLSADIQIVLDTLIPKTIEVQTVKNDWYRMSILPYRTLENVIEGAVITFVDITKAIRLQEELKNQLSEKINLLQEVHHRVKNNISNIEGLLSLQANLSENPEVKIALLDSVSRVQSMRILYDRLLIGKDYRDVPIKLYIESIVDSLKDVFANVKNIKVEKNICDFTITSKKAVSVGMIINELITNIYKYAFVGREKGEITIIIEKDANRVTLSIRDNGIGIDERTETKKVLGFGLTIVKMLVSQLKGTYSIKNDNGTKSVVQFDL